MRYIDKYRMHTAARAINVRFLQDCYRNDINNPIPSPAHPKLSYDDFKKSSYRDGVSGWKNLLLEEQKSEGHARCCYCMRRLNPSKGKMNYEHIIPRRFMAQMDRHSIHITLQKRKRCAIMLQWQTIL